MTHAELQQLIPSAALGALDAAEQLALEQHLSECSECRAEMDALRNVAGLLAWAAPTMTPPNAAALRQRILSEASGTKPLTAPRTLTLDSGRSAEAPTPRSSAPVARPSRSVPSNLPWLAAAASLTLAIASGGAYLNSRSENATLARALERSRVDAQATRTELASRDSVLSAFLGPMVHVVSLSESEQRQPSARIFWNHTKNLFIVTSFNVPQAPKGKTYQLWAMRKGKAPMSMGTFNPDPSGRALALVPVGTIADAGHIDNCAMTLEPEGGSPQPTETPRLMGAWRHVD